MKVDFNYLREKNHEKIKRINNPTKSAPVKILIFDKLMPYDIDILKFKTTDLYKEDRKRGVHGLDCGQVIKILNDQAILYGCGFDDFNKVVDFCIKENIRVINTSFGCSYSKKREEAIKRFYDFGGIWVAASGNDGHKPVDFPASSDYTVGVSATNSGDNNGPEVDTTADSYVTVKHLKRDDISTFNGTSASTPMITNSAGYYIYHNPSGNLDTFVNWLNKNEVDDLSKVLKYTKTFGKLEEGEKFFIFPNNLKDGELIMNKPCKIIIHHSLTKDGKVVDFNAIKRYHIETNGWLDIGYHYVIENVDGQYKILKGRDEKAIGAHTKGENANSIGICLVGNFDIAPPPKEQLQKLYELLRDIRSRHGELPIFGHCNFPDPKTGYRKTCPGTKFPMKEVVEKMEENKCPNDLSEWAKDGYDFVKENNISDGTRPKDPVTREEMWTMLYRFNKKGAL